MKAQSEGVCHRDLDQTSFSANDANEKGPTGNPVGPQWKINVRRLNHFVFSTWKGDDGPSHSMDSSVVSCHEVVARFLRRRSPPENEDVIHRPIALFQESLDRIVAGSKFSLAAPAWEGIIPCTPWCSSPIGWRLMSLACVLNRVS